MKYNNTSDQEITQKSDEQLHILKVLEKSEEYETRKDNRELKHWMVKALTSTLIFIVCVVITSMTVDLFLNKKHYNESIITSVFSNITELIKFLLS